MQKPPNRGPRPGSRSGRRPPPPPGTGAEVDYLEACRDAGRVVVLHLADGRTVEGRIEAFDRDLLTIDQPGGSIMIRKSLVRYLEEPEG